MKFWPFGKSSLGAGVSAAALANLSAISVVAAALNAFANTVDVEEIHFLLVLDDGSRETFVLRGELTKGNHVIRATDVLGQIFVEAAKTGFFQFGKGGSMRWIPLSRVKEVQTTTWPHEVERPT